MIPKIIHQIHLGPRPLNDKELYWQSTWKKYNPHWGFFLWNDSSAIDLPIKNYVQFKNCKNYAEQSDILRLEILYKFGGLYVDTDFECLRNIDGFLDKRDFVVCRHFEGEIGQAFIASSKGNKEIKKLLDGIPDREKKHKGKDSTMLYGPHYFTEMIDIKNTFSGEYVYPYIWTEENVTKNLKEAYPRAYAVHHWRTDWGYFDN